MTYQPQQQIRALFDNETIRVYQAYSDAIAESALKHNTFISPPFSTNRMTWIKPSFLWMMYRAGWSYKDNNQQRILAIDITHQGFEWALSHSCLSHPEPSMTHAEWSQLKEVSPVRIQWDPERNLRLEPLPYRSIQIGLSKTAVKLYLNQWIQKITDVTPLAQSIFALVKANKLDQAQQALPKETPYIYQMPTLKSENIMK